MEGYEERAEDESRNCLPQYLIAIARRAIGELREPNNRLLSLDFKFTDKEIKELSDDFVTRFIMHIFPNIEIKVHACTENQIKKIGQQLFNIIKTGNKPNTHASAFQRPHHYGTPKNS